MKKHDFVFIFDNKGSAFSYSYLIEKIWKYRKKIFYRIEPYKYSFYMYDKRISYWPHSTTKFEMPNDTNDFKIIIFDISRSENRKILRHLDSYKDMINQ